MTKPNRNMRHSQKKKKREETKSLKVVTWREGSLKGGEKKKKNDEALRYCVRKQRV